MNRPRATRFDGDVLQIFDRPYLPQEWAEQLGAITGPEPVKRLVHSGFHGMVGVFEAHLPDLPVQNMPDAIFGS